MPALRLDTSDYSFGYVAGWSSGKDLKELKASLETIRATAHELITTIDGHLAQLQKERQAQHGAAAGRAAGTGRRAARPGQRIFQAAPGATAGNDRQRKSYAANPD